MKKSLKSLGLKKQTISRLEKKSVNGGNLTGTGALSLGCVGSGATNALCNSVPIWEGGIGCVAK
ncbi:hypothetical protein [uncultured Aquimarina sp.]|uniref:hypothetical protein n=1 Tax=uncultured Aquimarina sp. TaxID=575652 RepID=UPI00261F8D28|nr:hypothetical protein [uncultured Aquimarina sp.]